MLGHDGHYAVIVLSHECHKVEDYELWLHLN